MNSSLASDVRIWHTSGNAPVGVGFIASPIHVITCAHVVADALGDKNLAYEKHAPKKEVEIDFPAFSNKTKRLSCLATIRSWAALHGPSPDDIAILELRQPIPKDSMPISVCYQYKPGDSIRAYGVRASIQDGAYIEGRYLGLLPGPRLQITSDQKELAIDLGCSGGAVWLANGNGVIGMATAAIMETSGLLLPIEEIGKFYAATTGLTLLTHGIEWSVDHLIILMFEEELNHQSQLQFIKTFPLGPAFDPYFVPYNIKRAYATRALAQAAFAENIIGTANALLLESLPSRPKNIAPLTLAACELPNPNFGWLNYWSIVFCSASGLSPRLVAALLAVSPPTLLNSVKNDVTALIEALRR